MDSPTDFFLLPILLFFRVGVVFFLRVDNRNVVFLVLAVDADPVDFLTNGLTTELLVVAVLPDFLDDFLVDFDDEEAAAAAAVEG